MELLSRISGFESMTFQRVMAYQVATAAIVSALEARLEDEQETNDETKSVDYSLLAEHGITKEGDEESLPPVVPLIHVTKVVELSTVPHKRKESEIPQQEVRTNRFFGKQKLPSLEFIASNRSMWSGPTKESNWVIPGKLLVGAYPFTWEIKKKKAIIYKKDLLKILDAGVTTFVCLQDEYECDSNEDHEQKFPIISNTKMKKVVQLQHAHVNQTEGKKLIFPYIYEAAIALKRLRGKWEDILSFLHLPIVDLDCTEDGPVLDLAMSLAKRLAASDGPHQDDVIYIHCWGGHGRTGTLVAVMLGLLFGISAEEALQRTQLYHDTRKCSLQVQSPQTEPQRQQVRRILASHVALQFKEELASQTFSPAPRSCFERAIEFGGRAETESKQPEKTRPLPLHIPATHAEAHTIDVEDDHIDDLKSFFLEEKEELTDENNFFQEEKEANEDLRADHQAYDAPELNDIDVQDENSYVEKKKVGLQHAPKGKKDSGKRTPKKSPAKRQVIHSSIGLGKSYKKRMSLNNPKRPSPSRKRMFMGKSPRERIVGYRAVFT